jgi:hypothetical protein
MLKCLAFRGKSYHENDINNVIGRTSRNQIVAYRTFKDGKREPDVVEFYAFADLIDWLYDAYARGWKVTLRPDHGRVWLEIDRRIRKKWLFW